MYSKIESVMSETIAILLVTSLLSLIVVIVFNFIPSPTQGKIITKTEKSTNYILEINWSRVTTKKIPVDKEFFESVELGDFVKYPGIEKVTLKSP